MQLQNRRDILRAGLATAAAAALGGCAAQTPSNGGGTPSTQPVTQAYDIASGIWTNVVAAAAIVTAIPGLVPATDVVLINAAITQGNTALATWQANLGQPANVTLEAEFYALLPGLAQLIANAKASKAGTTTAALSLKMGLKK